MGLAFILKNKKENATMPKHFWLHPLAQAIAIALPSSITLMPFAARADLLQTQTASLTATSSRVTKINAQSVLTEGTPDNHPASAKFPVFSSKTGVLTGTQIDFTRLTLEQKVSLAAQWADKTKQATIGFNSQLAPQVSLELPNGEIRNFPATGSKLPVSCNSVTPPTCPQTVSLITAENVQRADSGPLDAYVGESGTIVANLDTKFAHLAVDAFPPNLNSATVTETVNKLGGTLIFNYSYLNHAQPLVGNTQSVLGFVDFGTVLQGENVQDQKWSIHNNGTKPNVGLDLTGIATTDPAATLFDLGLNGGLFSGLDAGVIRDFNATLDTAQPGVASATYQFQLADSALGASASRQNYTKSLTFKANVAVRTPVLKSATLPVGFHPAAPVVVDINRDGKPDLIVLDRDNKAVKVYRGNPAGGFDNKISSQLSVGNNPVALAVGDIDNDGHPDVVMANYGDNTVSVLRGDGSFGFQPATTVVAGSGSIAVALNDLNRDGKLDLVIANTRANRVRIQLGLGNGQFGTAASFASGTLPYGLAVADINRDGKLDVAVTNPTSNRVNVLLGNGDGSLQARHSFPVGNNPLSLTLADVGGDGKLDLLIANHGGDSISLLRGTGNNNLFAAATTAAALEAGAGPTTLTTADINKDGHPDLVVANASLNTVDVLANLGHGTFAAPVAVTVGTQPTGIAVADINDDGKPDITVTNTGDNSLSLLFNSTVIAPSGRFVAAPGSPVSSGGNGPQLMAISDVNRDGKPDLAVANVNGNAMALLMANGNGGFQPPRLVATGSVSPIFADVNGDGKVDLIFGTTNDISVMLGNGDGNFPAIQHVAPDDSLTSIASGDINGDGKLDIAFADQLTSNNVSVMLGIGDGAFQSAQSIATGNLPMSLALGDINGDGKLDLAFANSKVGSNTVSVLLGKGDGSFQVAQQIATGTRPVSVTLDDVNGDGKPDLAAANLGDNTVALVLGNGDGGFQVARTFVSGRSPNSVVLEDFNRDGKPDLAVTNNEDNTVSILAGNGDGSFQEAQPFATGLSPRSVVFGDIDGDGRTDLATTNFSDNTLSILLNRAP
jgi:FG-GAP-like repeat